jgi:hypothetical protein
MMKDLLSILMAANASSGSNTRVIMTSTAPPNVPNVRPMGTRFT